MNLDTLKNTWAGWSTKKKAIVVIIVLAIIGGISSKKEQNKSAAESAPVAQEKTAPENAPSTSAPKNKVEALVNGLGLTGWAQCTAAQISMSAMIARGDPGVQQLKSTTDTIGDVLGNMRQYMLANNIQQSQLDAYLKGAISQIRNGDQAFDAMNQCIGSMNKVSQ
jgi:hypothetical protein